MARYEPKELQVTICVDDTLCKGVESWAWYGLQPINRILESGGHLMVTSTRAPSELLRDIHKKDSPYKSLADLRGKKIGVQADTTGKVYADKNKAANGYQVVVFNDLALQENNVKSGRVDAAINDNGVLYDYVKDNPDVTVATEFNTGEQYGFAAKKGDGSKLTDKFNELLAKAKTDGKYDEIFKKWFGVAPKK